MLIWVCFAVILLIISVNDFLFFRIENEYVISLLVLYILSCVFHVSGNNFTDAAKITAIVFLISFLLNQLNLIGGGDVKLLVPLLLFSENNMYDFILGTSLGGLAVSTIYMFFRDGITDLRRKIFFAARNRKKKKFRLLSFVLLSLYRINKRSAAFKCSRAGLLKQEIPYGVALSCGGLFVILDVMFR